MADLYSVIEGATPSQQDILQAELFTKQVLEAQFPDLDLREGTGLRDTLIRPKAYLLAKLKAGFDLYFSQNSVAGIDDSSSSDLTDAILSNWFLERKIGTKSIINARLFFARAKNVSITSDTYFSPDNTLKFFPQESNSYLSDSMQYDSYSDEYYLDIDLIAESEGSAYNISTGSLLYFSNFDPYFLRAEINFLKDTAVSSETNTEFIARAKTAISTRNLINSPSIDSNLREEFNFLNKIFSVGKKDQEMVRDQIQAVFTPEDPRSLTNLTSVGTTATATLANHGFNTGQYVVISGATPSAYNGTYQITYINSSSFSYVMATTAASVSVLPVVQSKTDPVYIHQGGMVDVYCGVSRASSIVQVTTDDTGKAQLTGPIYNFSRSSISGGEDDDSLPLELTATVVAPGGVSIVSTNATLTTSSTHQFTVGQTVTVSGLLQNKTITAISCVGVTVTGTITGHDFQIGNKVTISGVTPAAYNGTFTITAKTTNTFSYTVPANIVGSGSGTMIATINLLNGDKVITGVTANTLTYSLGQTSSTAVTGTGTVSAPVPYSFYNYYRQQKSITSITRSGLVATVTLPRHAYGAGRTIQITGADQAEYNGYWVIKEILDNDNFTFDLPSSASSAVTPATGTISSIWLRPEKDYGFSQNQILTVDFGSNYANKTASFQIDYFDYLDSVQAYLDTELVRVICADYLARGFNLYVLDCSVVSYNSTAASGDTVSELIQEYLDLLNPGDMFIMSDLVARLRANGVTSIKLPLDINYTKYTRDLLTPTTGVIEDVLDPNDRTSVFVLGTVTTDSESIGTGSFTPVII